MCGNCNLNKATAYCMECKEFFCKSCHTAHDTNKGDHKVVSTEDLRSGRVMLPVTTDQRCKDHEGEIRRCYCVTCGKLVCRDCFVQDHRQHQIINLKEVSVNLSDKLPSFNTGEKWVQSGQFSTKPEMTYPSGITVSKDGDITVTNMCSQALSCKIFSQDGKVKYTFKGPFNAVPYDIGITPDNKYILPGDGEILFYDSQGNRLDYPKVPTYDTLNNTSNPFCLVADGQGRILSGLDVSTISIHSPDGQLISKFYASGKLNYLAVSSSERIVRLVIPYG